MFSNDEYPNMFLNKERSLILSDYVEKVIEPQNITAWISGIPSIVSQLY